MALAPIVSQSSWSTINLILVSYTPLLIVAVNRDVAHPIFNGAAPSLSSDALPSNSFKMISSESPFQYDGVEGFAYF